VHSACAVAGSDNADEFPVLDLLAALVRKSLLVAHRSGQTRFSMLETIRQFAEEKLVARGSPAEARSAHAQHFADRETEVMALWDSPRQREAYDWFGTELANLRTAFRWAADHGDSTSLSPSLRTWGFFGLESRTMSQSSGRGADRTRRRNRAPAGSEFVCDRVSVLDGRQGR